MPFIIEWYIPDRAIYEKFMGDVSLEEVKQVSQQQNQMLDSAANKVIIIVDQSEQASSPLNLNQLRDALSSMKHPHLDYILTISSSNKVIAFLSRLMAQTFGVRLHISNSLRQALQHMQQQDPSLQAAISGKLQALGTTFSNDS